MRRSRCRTEQDRRDRLLQPLFLLQITERDGFDHDVSLLFQPAGLPDLYERSTCPEPVYEFVLG